MTKTNRVLTVLAASMLFAGAAYAGDCSYGHAAMVDQMADATSAPVLQSTPSEEVVASVDCSSLTGAAKASCEEAALTR